MWARPSRRRRSRWDALTVNGGAASTLKITAATAPINQVFGLTLGNVCVNGNATFNVANNGTGSELLRSGQLTTAAPAKASPRPAPGL